MLDVLLDALLDSLKVLPILIIMYLLIELIELKTTGDFFKSKILKNKFSPLIGAGIGVIPQCGFSVVATDLYTKKDISLATLLSIYVATSDEALPILLSNLDSIKYVLPLIAVKVLLAVIIGYGTMLFFKIFKIKENKAEVVLSKTSSTIKEINSEETDHEHKENVINDSTIDANVQSGVADGETHEDHDHEEDEHGHFEKGCCGHKIGEEKKFNAKEFFVHPLLHSLKLFIYIFLFNLILGTIIYFIGEEAIITFMDKGKYLQPLVTSLIGLIPNCASSVFITQLFTMGGLTFGSCIAGLCCNAGIGMAVLIKQNKNKLHTFYIILALYLFSVTSGMLITLIESVI